MCGRFQLSVKGKEVSERFNVEIYDNMFNPSFNCAPSQVLPVITNAEPYKLNFFQWGLIPAWAKDTKIGNKLINARSETIVEKPSFKKAFEQRRCLIPANGFYEWRRDDKIPFRIFLKEESVFTMAGIWETWYNEQNKLLQTFTIITTKANDVMKQIHHRMPVILSKKDEKEWLRNSNMEQLSKLFKPIDNDKLGFYPVSKRINSPNNNFPELISPVNIDDPEPTLF